MTAFMVLGGGSFYGLDRDVLAGGQWGIDTPQSEGS